MSSALFCYVGCEAGLPQIKSDRAGSTECGGAINYGKHIRHLRYQNLINIPKPTIDRCLGGGVSDRMKLMPGRYTV